MTGESLQKTDTNFESEENTMKKILALLMAVAMIAAFCACAQQSADTAPAASTDTAAETTTDTAAETPAASDGALIKVGIINNDPNESGYRTANDKDLKAMFTEENGYDASFAYSLKNDEQIAAAQKFIQDEVDYVASIVSDMAKEGQTAVDWLASQNLETYNIIHIQGVMGSAAQIGRTGALDEQVAANDNWNMVTQQTAEWNAETAQQIVQSVIDSGKEFNVIYAENDDMAKGAVAALDKANISHGVGKDVIVMGFDCNKWALEELLAGNWNYDGQCNPFQASYIDAIIKDLQAGKAPAEKTIIMDEKGFDASTITQEDVDNYGI